MLVKVPQKVPIGQKRIDLRNKLFPHIRATDLWHRKTSTGFTTIPRGLPLVFVLMDKLSKGKPISSTYFELWCRMFDESFIKLKPREMAFHSGFSGQRAQKTWTERMKLLEELGFIETKPGLEGELGYAVVFNPYRVLEKLFKSQKPGLDEADYNALIERLNEIGATDLDEVPAVAALPTQPTIAMQPTMAAMPDVPVVIPPIPSRKKR